MSDNEGRGGVLSGGESPEFKFGSRQGDDEKMRQSRRRDNGADSLQDLLKNAKFDDTAGEKEVMGDGISPDKRHKQKRKPKGYED